MAGETENSMWPLPKFSFSVQVGSEAAVSFQEMSGLESETQPIESRHGDSPTLSWMKRPGVLSVGNVTLKKETVPQESGLWSWQKEPGMNTIQRQTVLVRLLNEAGAVVMTWALNNAWPTKVEGTELASEGNEVAVESVEIAFETMLVNAGE